MNVAVRNAYLGSSVSTASPARLLVQLFERLVLDCERGQKALFAKSFEEANEQLQHAQRIVDHLMSTLEVDGMPAGQQIMALYGFLQRRLVAANVKHDMRAAGEALKVARDLCAMWTECASIAAGA